MCRVFMGNYGPNDLAQIVYFSSLQNKKEKNKCPTVYYYCCYSLCGFILPFGSFHDNWNIADISLCRAGRSVQTRNDVFSFQLCLPLLAILFSRRTNRIADGPPPPSLFPKRKVLL